MVCAVSGQSPSAAIGTAIEAKAGLVSVHSRAGLATFADAERD